MHEVKMNITVEVDKHKFIVEAASSMEDLVLGLPDMASDILVKPAIMVSDAFQFHKAKSAQVFPPETVATPSAPNKTFTFQGLKLTREQAESLVTSDFCLGLQQESIEDLYERFRFVGCPKIEDWSDEDLQTCLSEIIPSNLPESEFIEAGINPKDINPTKEDVSAVEAPSVQTELEQLKNTREKAEKIIADLEGLLANAKAFAEAHPHDRPHN